MKNKISICLAMLSLLFVAICPVSAKAEQSVGVNARLIIVEKTNVKVSGAFHSGQKFTATVEVTYTYDDNGNGRVIGILGAEVIKKEGDVDFDVIECIGSKDSNNSIHVYLQLRASTFEDFWAGGKTVKV